MLEFKDVTLQDKEVITGFFADREMLICPMNFATMFIWNPTYQTKWTLENGWFYQKSMVGGYACPIGDGDIREPIERLMEDAAREGTTLVLRGVLPHQAEAIEKAFAGQFDFTELRDEYEYVYSAQKLATLAGKKMHAKRNYINRLTGQNTWAFEPITPENIGEVAEMNEQWCLLNNCDKNESLRQEGCAVRLCLKLYQKLDLMGGLLRVDGRVVAYSFASLLGTNAADIHVEKAFSEVDGAYPLINREMVKYIIRLHPQVEWINREEDLGDEGLRKAKLSYYPELLLQKIKAVQKP